MGPVYFVIAIMGCGDGSTACTPVMTVPTRYESEAACEAATTTALLANSNFDYPSLLAQCRQSQEPKSAERDRDPPVKAETRRG